MHRILVYFMYIYLTDGYTSGYLEEGLQLEVLLLILATRLSNGLLHLESLLYMCLLITGLMVGNKKIKLELFLLKS